MGGATVHVLRLSGELGTLADAEAVLFVCYHQCQIVKGHILGEEGVGADDKVQLPRLEAFFHLPLLGGGQSSRQQSHPYPLGGEEFCERSVVLFRQHLGGCHQGGLTAPFHHQPGGKGGNHRLTAAHISLHQTIHGLSAGEIPPHLLHHPTLRPRGGEGEQLQKRGSLPGWDGMSRPQLTPIAQETESHRQIKQLLKGQSPSCRLLHLVGGRVVDGGHRLPFFHQLVLLEDGGGQGLLHLLSALRHRFSGEDAHHVVGDTRRQMVNGDDTPRKIALPHLFEDGAIHGAPPPLFLHRTAEDIFLPRLHGPLDVALVEEGDVEGTAPVHHLHLHQLHPLADAGEPWVLRRYGGDAHPLSQGCVADRIEGASILVSPGIGEKQLFYRRNPQFF